MDSESPKKTPIPQLFGSYERWHARMRGFYANRENLHKYAELRPTDEELKRFSAEHPDMGEKLEKCRIEKEYLMKGTAIGTLGCVIAAMRKTSVKPYILVVGVSGFFASLFGARNLGVWVTGTYKFDTATLNAAYLSWVESSRAAAAAAAAAADGSASIGTNTAAASTTD